jgi:aconitate hydratase
VGFFPVDDETLLYLRLTARRDEDVALVESYCKEQGLFRTDRTADPEFTDAIELDLGTVEASLAGPKRPAGSSPATDQSGHLRVN